MEYTVNHLAKLSGVSTRTLRYYDNIGLLKPLRISSNGYRIYGEYEIDLLQQILFYRALDFSLNEIKEIVFAPSFNRVHALQSHLSSLESRKEQIDLLISNVKKTISAMKGETMMDIKEKFEGFKQEMIQGNEAAYGQEIRAAFGDAVIDSSNARLTGMTGEQWEAANALEGQIKLQLAKAVKSGDIRGGAARKLCELHRQWLLMFWPENSYSKEAHAGLAECYIADERFRSYFETAAAGGTQFLRDALTAYCSD